MHYETSPPLRYSTIRGTVCVVEGYGVEIRIRHGRLHVKDGFPRKRRERVYSRVNHGLSRLVLLGHAGMVSLEALRWLTDVGIAFVQIDRDGRLLLTSTPSEADAKLRRAQALATQSRRGVEIARFLLRQKLAGQRGVLERLDPGGSLLAGFDDEAAELEQAQSVEELVLRERNAAFCYWQGWAAVEVKFRRSDLARVPEHWQRFGQRSSPFTSAPRLAVNPANALLNYLYAIVEAETRIACLMLGLDPSLGIVHADYRARDSLALDLMEAVRPAVDAYVLDFLAQRTFKATDFHETARGICRLLPPTTAVLAGTAPGWGRLIAPVCEEVAAMLAATSATRVTRVRTPLTNAQRKAGRTSKRPRPAIPAAPRPDAFHACRACGGEVPHADRVYCNDCLPGYRRDQFRDSFRGSGLATIERRKQEGVDPTHGDAAAARRGETNARRKQEVREWEERFGRVVDLSAFDREILPHIQKVPLSRLTEATGLSLRYVSQIRRGEKAPHPRHWQGLRRAAGEWESRRAPA
jgi:CRISPR-associated endonuclease Cas1